MRRRAVLAMVATLLVVPAIASTQSTELAVIRRAIEVRHPDVRWVSAPRLESWIRAGNVVLLDARQPAEFAVSHLPRARRVDPDGAVDALARELSSRRVVVYCSVGWRSAAVASRLARAGVRDVYNLERGIFGWANDGRHLVRGDRSVAVVHPFDALWGRMLRSSLHAYAP